MTQYNVIGRPTRLNDGQAKVAGTIRFAADLDRPGLLHARLVTSLHAHARLRSIDTAAALKSPGVAAVLTADQLPQIAPASRGRLLLARGRVMFAGQPIALVLADSETAAEDGAALVTVDYEPLPFAITLDEALADDAPLVWPNGVPTGGGEAGGHGADTGGGSKERKANNIAGEGSYTRGDLAAGFAQADTVIERTYWTPMVHQSAVEPHSIVAEPNLHNNGATVWASTQSLFDVRRDVAKVLGVPETEVRVIPMAVGGGFGAKNGLYETLVAAAACAVHRPVHLTLTRSEEMLAVNPAPPVRIQLRLGAKKDGSLTALEAEVVVDNGCYPFDIAGFLAFMLASFYPIPNFRVRGRDVLTFKQSAGAYRAPGAPSVVFALDCALDELAGRLNLDQFEIRLKNAARPGDLMADGDAWASMGMVEVLNALRAHPLWQNREQSRAAGRAIGISVGGWPGGVEPAAAACSLHRDGVIQVNVGSVDLHGTSTSFALMAAEILGVTPDQVRVVNGDTDNAPFSGAASGSKITYATGAAVVAAAREARQQILSIAAEELEAAIEDLDIVAGAVQVKGVPSKALPLSKLAGKTMRFGAKHAPVFAQGRIAHLASAPAFCAQLAEVSVDKETGDVQLHNLVVVQDVGQAINPLAVQGQLTGGAAQGIGWALYEDMQYDERGQLLSGSWLEYAVPHSWQVPPMETILVEVPSELGPFGARGVGEAPVVPTAAAIANAIAAATGSRFTDLPMTPPRILHALQN